MDGELGKGGQAVVKSMTITDEDGTKKKFALKVFKVGLSLFPTFSFWRRFCMIGLCLY